MNLKILLGFVSGVLVAFGIVYTVVRPEPALKHVVVEYPMITVAPAPDAAAAIQKTTAALAPPRSRIVTPRKVKPSKPAPMRPLQSEIAMVTLAPPVRAETAQPAPAPAPGQIAEQPPAVECTPRPALNELEPLRAYERPQPPSVTLQSHYASPNAMGIYPSRTVIVDDQPPRSISSELYRSRITYWIAFPNGAIIPAESYWVNGNTFSFVTPDHKLWQMGLGTQNIYTSVGLPWPPPPFRPVSGGWRRIAALPYPPPR